MDLISSCLTWVRKQRKRVITYLKFHVLFSVEWPWCVLILMDIKNQFKCFTCYSEVLNLNYSLSSIRLRGVLKKLSYKCSEGEESVNQRQFCLAYLHILIHSEATKTNVWIFNFLPPSPLYVGKFEYFFFEG